ncbi:MAG: PepSY domain-containing protein [Gammaproteobacteria bacterium]|nr:PepSY domain-containing protein [Gammaproteobacteria bacterium]MDH5693412.1 PepSY domain-containing protein [Gammaproteobacteria bacterium]
MIRILLLLTTLLIVSNSVMGDEGERHRIDHERVRILKEAGKIIPLEKILQIARSEKQGRVLDVELEEENGRYVYEIEMLTDQGEVWEVEIDAQSGELVEMEKEH